MKKFYIFLFCVFLFFNVKAQENVAGNALQYKGTSCLNFGNVDLGLTTQFTIMMWVRWDTTPSAGNPWSNMATINSIISSDDGIFWMQHNSNNSKFEFALTTINSAGAKNRNIIYSSTNPQQGIWYHLTAKYDGARMYLFVNGILESSTNKTGLIAPMTSNYYFTLGAWAHSNNNYRKFNGSIDEVSIWNTAIGSADILAKMNQRLIGNETGLAAYWRFDETSGTTIYDLSPSGINSQNIACANSTAATSIASDAPIYNSLPVNLLYFQPSCGSDSNVVVRWATATETNNDYFTIFRSFDGISWEILARVDGTGNSNQVVYYEYLDKKPENKTIYYKLKQTDFDGRSEEFNMISVFCLNNDKQFNMFPNPASDNINISFNNIAEMICNLNVLIFDASGRLMKTQQQLSTKGFNQATIDISDLPLATYFLQVKMGNFLVQTKEFIKQ